VQPRSLDGAQIVLLLSLDSRPVCSPRRLRHSRYVHAALPSSKLEVMEGQSHIAMITAPYLFARLIISSLAS
jgi:pimeloyl-ACP methyl ester carboxylesterase